ncbi:hypothetical protein OSTOST_18634 [Ostertagia ostertagi]
MYLRELLLHVHEVVSSKINRISKCTVLNIEPEGRAKPSLLNHQLTEPVLKKEKIEGESDETTRKTRQQINKLTERQRAILIRTFAEVEKNLVKNGLKILLMLFAEDPHYKQIWPQFREIPDSSLMNAIELSLHVWTGCNYQLYESRERSRHPDEPNRKGAHQMERASGPHREMLEPVLAVVKECNDDFDNETKQAWTTLYHIIADLIEIFV